VLLFNFAIHCIVSTVMVAFEINVYLCCYLLVDCVLGPSAALQSIWFTYCQYSSRHTCRPSRRQFGHSLVCPKTNTFLMACLYSFYQKDMKLAKYALI